VDVIIDIVNTTRDRSPGDAILVLDESVFFLNILEAALNGMHEPVDVFRFDGGHDPAERHQIMQAFATASGTRVMLATRGAGGQGLNVQCANVVVRCGPWWKSSWEEQALARSYRPGQTKPVWLYEISAKSCRVETYKRKVRGQKSKVNTSIMGLLTLDEGEEPSVWNE
jgi:SNF2 family DNA or RNA helicase